MFRLLVLKGTRSGQTLTLRGPTILVGCGSDCPLRIVGKSVARHHARFEEREGGVFVSSLSATAPVIVNGEAIVECRLSPGDRIGVGEFEFVFDPVVPQMRDGQMTLHGGVRMGGRFIFVLMLLFILLQVCVLAYFNDLFWRSRLPMFSAQSETQGSR